MNVIEWLKTKATIEISEPQIFDNITVVTKSYFFRGTLSSRMIAKIKKESSKYRDHNRTATYSASDENSDWSVTVGAYKSTANNVRFIANEYIIQ